MNRQLVFVCACILIITPLPFVGVPNALAFVVYELIGLTLLFQALRRRRDTQSK
jgi:isoprenylcysteine carboxyl methyltransferase (ICMT) family protein YpbQ